MFTLGRIMFNELVKKEEHYVLILGIDDAGKTTYAESFKANFDKSFVRRHPSKMTSTVGLNFVKVDCGHIILNLWDIGGDKELRSIWDCYYNKCRVLIFVVDISNTKRLNEALMCLDEILKVEHISRIPLLILLNKCEKSNKTFVHTTMEESLDKTVSTSQNDADFNHFNNSTNGNKNSVDLEDVEKFRLQVYNHVNESSRECDDFAILSVSAFENINIHKSALWVLDVILTGVPR